jgi:hypothetical protein
MDQDTQLQTMVIGKIEGQEIHTSVGSRIFVGHSNLDDGVYLQLVSPDGHIVRLQVSRPGAAALGALLAGEAADATPFEIEHIKMTEPAKFEWQQVPSDSEGFIRPEKPLPDPLRPWRVKQTRSEQITEAAVLAGSGPALAQPPSSQQMPEDPSEPG